MILITRYKQLFRLIMVYEIDDSRPLAYLLWTGGYRPLCCDREGNL